MKVFKQLTWTELWVCILKYVYLYNIQLQAQYGSLLGFI